MEFDMLTREPWTIIIWLAVGVGLLGTFLWSIGTFSSARSDRASLVVDSAPPQRVVPENRDQVMWSYAPVVRQAAPAVVNVYARKVVERSRSPFFDDPFFRHFFGLGEPPSMPKERVQSSLGSGVIVRGDGIIVTNNHVVAGGDELLVSLSDRREFEAEVILADERTDLAILRIDTKGQTVPSLTFRDSDTVQVGDIVLAIGNPFGVGQTTTTGIVSALARTQVGISDYQFFIQTDAAVNPGNSGGALVTLDGKLIGINTAIFTRTGGSIGIGFAIPSNMVRTVVETAVDGGKLSRPWMGVSAQTVTPDIAQSLGLDRPRGVLVREVVPDGPGDKGGLQVGDVILSVDGFEINDPQSLRYRVATAGAGKVVKVEYIRKGQTATASVKLVMPPEDPPRDITRLDGRTPLSGATVANLSPAFAEELRIDETHGVVVLGTERGSPAARIRLRPGDILLEVNGYKVQGVETLRNALSERASEWTIVIRRGAEIFTLTF